MSGQTFAILFLLGNFVLWWYTPNLALIIFALFFVGIGAFWLYLRVWSWLHKYD